MSQTFEEKVEVLASELGEKIAALAKNDSEMTDGLAIAAIALIDSAVELDDVFEEFGEELEDDYDFEEYDDDDELFGALPDIDDDFFGRSSIEDDDQPDHRDDRY